MYAFFNIFYSILKYILRMQQVSHLIISIYQNRMTSICEHFMTFEHFINYSIFYQNIIFK